MYLDKEWYSLKAKKSVINENDPVARLDVSILQESLLEPILGIQDPKNDSRIDFVGGIRGLASLNGVQKQICGLPFQCILQQQMI